VGGTGFFPIALRGWWEAMFEAMRAPGHRFRYRDLLTGNLSIAATVFSEVGGFDETFRCHEDFEFGARLLASGVDLAFCDRAAGIHREGTDLDRALARKRAEGAADVQMLRRHPHLLGSLPLGWFREHASRRQRFHRALTVGRPAAAWRLAGALRRLLVPLEAARLRGRWRKALDDLLMCHYWLGVETVLPGRGQVGALQAACRAVPPPAIDRMAVDLTIGRLDDAVHAIDLRRPDALRVSWGGAPVGDIPAEAGAERLRGSHLRRALVEELAEPLIRVLAAQGITRVSVSETGALTTTEVPRARLALGPKVATRRDRVEGRTAAG
jgi:hypothetical protein